MAQIIGVVTNDAVSKTTSSGKKLVEFSLVEVYRYKNKTGERKEITTFYNCTIWNNEKIAKYLTKGKPLMLWGTIEANPYTANDGTVKATLRMSIKDYDFLPISSNKKEQPQATPETTKKVAAEDMPF